MSSGTFLFCVESGHFEAQTLLAIECLRKFGGEFADFPVLVVTPRYGPSLVKETLRSFDKLGARYVRKDFRNKHAWYPYTNKALAALVGDDTAETEQVLWLDSDVLLVSPPRELLLERGEDFTICSVDKNVGSSGPADPYEAYWVALARAYGMTVDDLPWVRPATSDTLVRLRLHSGVYSFRRGRGLGREFVSAMDTMLSCGVTFSKALPYPGDDIALAFAIVKLGLKFRILPMNCNYEITPDSRIYEASQVQKSSILHYHHALTKIDQTPWLLAQLDRERPDVADWLRTRLPINPRVGGPFRRGVRRLLAELRRNAAAKQISLSRVAVDS